jgi:hypothetical protein
MLQSGDGCPIEPNHFADVMVQLRAPPGRIKSTNYADNDRDGDRQKHETNAQIRLQQSTNGSAAFLKTSCQRCSSGVAPITTSIFFVAGAICSMS